MKRGFSGPTSSWAACGVLALGAILSGGCGRDTDLAGTVPQESAPVGPRPTYRFAEGLDEQYPEQVRFLRAFLETCLTGDYDGYRKFVSHRRLPETRERFERMYAAIATLKIVSIGEVPVVELPPPVYLVNCEVVYAENRKPIFRKERLRIAILIFKEGDEFRMLPAPRALQPEPDEVDDDEASSATQPVSSAPYFPWDQSGDG